MPAPRGATITVWSGVSQTTVLLAGERERRDCGIVLEYCLLALRRPGKVGLGQGLSYRPLWHLPMDGPNIGLGARRRSLMAAVTSEGAPGAHHQLAERLRAAVLGPRG